MLSRDSLNAALPLTSILDNNSILITPAPNTPLEKLVVATRVNNGLSYTNSSFNDKEYIINIDAIEYMANVKDPVLNVSKHDILMDELVDVIGTAVRDHILFAKTVVAPAVEDLVKRTMRSLNELTPSSLLGMEVVTWSPPKPLLNSSLVAAIHKFEEVPFDVPSMLMDLPSLTAKEIIDLMKSGAGSLDKDIDEWAAIKGESFFSWVWENIFQIKQIELNDRNVITFRDYIYNREDSLDVSLAIYLLSRKLAEDPLPNTVMKLYTFNKTVIEYRNQSAARLSIAINDLDKIDKIQQLVRSVDGHTTIVNESVYRKWIEAGGENEILFGNMLSLPIRVTVDSINKDADKLLAIWNSHAAVTATIERNRLFMRTKEILTKHFIDQLREASANNNYTLSSQQAIMERFTECLDNVYESEMDHIYDLCLKLLCSSRFNKTDARRILTGIERVKKENPGVSVREAAAISVIEYISYWVTSQFKINKI
jgi:hypothetical protein